MDTEVLQQLGLSKSEIKVYITLLDLGSSTTGPLMNKAKVSSSKIYGILSRLLEKGLVSVVTKEKTKWYAAVSPTALWDYVHEKETELQGQKQQLKLLVPELVQRQKLNKDKVEAQLYVGWKGIMTAFNTSLEQLQPGDDYIGFAHTEPEEASQEVKQFFNQYQRKRQEKKMKVRLLAEYAQKKIFNAPLYRKFRNFEVRYVLNCPPGLIIFKDTLLISTFQEPVAVIVCSKPLAQGYRRYFDLLWKKAEK